MLKKILIVFLSSIFCIFCLGQASAQATSSQKKGVEESPIIIGALEKVRILPANIIYDTRIDTGATTTSIHAGNMEIFERDGKKWVKFDLQGEEKTETVEMKIKEFRNIKRHGAPDQKRAVVTLHLVLGKVSQEVDVTLNDRSKFTYPGLIGRNFLKPNHMIVDVSQKYTANPAQK